MFCALTILVPSFITKILGTGKCLTLFVEAPLPPDFGLFWWPPLLFRDTAAVHSVL